MYKMNKITIILVLFIYFPFSILLAQETEEKPKLKLAFQNKLGTELLSQYSKNEDIDSYRKTPFVIGFYGKYKKFEADVDFFFTYLNGDFRYELLHHLWVGVSAGMCSHTIEIERSYLDSYYSYNYTEGDVKYYKYTVNVDYGLIFLKRFDLRAGVSLGSLNSNSCNIKDYINSYNYSTNKKARKTDSYQLDPTLIYGAQIALTMLPNPNKDRRFPVAPFFSLSFMGNSISNISRAVKIEEWVPGNVVYSETASQSSLDYDIFSFKGQAGIRWYFNY